MVRMVKWDLLVYLDPLVLTEPLEHRVLPALQYTWKLQKQKTKWFILVPLVQRELTALLVYKAQ
jgi:hypothetical protein